MVRAVVSGLVNARDLALGAAGAVVAAACLAPLFWPLFMLLGGLDEVGTSFAPLLATEPWLLLARTLALAAAVLAVTLAVGLPMGFLAARTDTPGRRVALVAHAAPMFVPPLLPALGWFYLFGRDGLVGGETSAGLLFSDLGAVLVLGLTFAPIVTSLAALALWNVDPSQEEAARVVARPPRIVARILLPAISPAIALAAVVVVALTLSEVGAPMFLRVRTYAAAVFARLGGVDFAPAEAFVLLLPVLLVALGLAAVERRSIGRRSFAVLGLRSFQSAPFALGRWRWPAAVFCWSITALSIAPLLALGWRAGFGGFADLPLWIGGAVWNSLVPAAWAASAIVALGVVLGPLLSRRNRVAGHLDLVALLAFVAPGALLGVGLAAIWNQPGTGWVYQTSAIIALGFVGRYAIVGVRTLAVACTQTPAQIEDAARVFGAGYLRRLTGIVVPLHWRAILGAWVFAMVFCLRDLETAVLYYPPGRAPLAVRVFTLEANGPEPVVAALASVQVLLTLALLGFALGAAAMRPRRP